jgi:ethanolamine-phosphate phospho-lyase
MSSSLAMSLAAFVSSSLYVVYKCKYSLQRPKAGENNVKRFLKTTTPTTTTALSKDKVAQLRSEHFSKSVSVSYANSGPLMIVKGRGTKLIDESGVEYLDTRNNVAHVGHSHPHVVQAIQTQVATLNTNTRYLHPNISLLASRLAAMFPDPLSKVFFVNSGSEANDLALRLARAYTKSVNTIVVDGAYHGHTLATLQVSPYKYESSQEFTLQAQSASSPSSKRRSTPNPSIYQVPCPDTYRGEYRDQSTAGAQYAKYVQEACRQYQSQGESVGAFILESGMSVAGVILPPPEYIRKSVEAVRQAGGVYIADEVQTGFGRLGSCRWAFEYGDENVVPDIVTVGKPFGNGMPLGAVITSPKIAAAFESMGVEYFNTFGGNPVCAAAGLAMLDVLEQEQLQTHALEMGQYLQSKFRELQNKAGLDIIGHVRGSGLFLGIELVRSQTTLEPATRETSFLCTTLKERYRVLSSIDGLHDNVLVVKPPMSFSKDDADYFVQSFAQAVGDLRKLGDGIEKISKTPT